MGGGNTKEGAVPKPARDAWEVEGAALDRSPATRDATKVVVLGLDGVGKTRLANIVHGQGQWWDANSKTVPWRRHSIDTAGSAVDLWVASGFAEHRRYWDEVCADASHFVYVISLADPLRLPMAWSEMLGDIQTRRPVSLLVVMTSCGATSLTATGVLNAFSSSFASIPAGTRWTTKDIDLAADPHAISSEINAGLAWLVAGGGVA